MTEPASPVDQPQSNNLPVDPSQTHAASASGQALAPSGPPQEDGPLRRAIALAVENVRAGREPFGAVLQTKTGEWYEGVNDPIRLSDPTAHAEVNAIRAAAAVHGPDLSGAVLYSSGQPCPMCLAAAIWAQVNRVVYAATQEEAAAVGLDNGPIYTQVCGGTPEVSGLKLQRGAVEGRLEPLRQWASQKAR